MGGRWVGGGRWATDLHRIRLCDWGLVADPADEGARAALEADVETDREDEHALTCRGGGDQLVGQWVSRSVDQLVSWSVGWLVGWSVGRLVGWSVSWSVDRLLGWSVGRLVGRLVVQLFGRTQIKPSHDRRTQEEEANTNADQLRCREALAAPFD